MQFISISYYTIIKTYYFLFTRRWVALMNQHLINSIMEAFQEIIPQDISIAISDCEQYFYYRPSNEIDLKIHPGDAIQAGTTTYQTLQTKQKTMSSIDKHVIGTTYFGISYPIYEDDQLSGCITFILPKKPNKFTVPFLIVHTIDRWLPIEFNDIMVLEADNRKTTVISKNLVGIHKFSLSELELHLPSDIFIRCHRSYIVNIHYIAEIRPDAHSTFLLIMKDGAKIPVSQSYASQFRKTLHF